MQSPLEYWFRRHIIAWNVGELFHLNLGNVLDRRHGGNQILAGQGCYVASFAWIVSARNRAAGRNHRDLRPILSRGGKANRKQKQT